MMKREIAEHLQLPGDLALGAVNLTASGQNELLVENYKGILEYSAEKIILQTRQCQVEVLGEGLQIVYYTAEEMKINGQIHEIIYS